MADEASENGSLLCRGRSRLFGGWRGREEEREAWSDGFATGGRQQ